MTARVFANETHALRALHPGSGAVGKLLMVLIRTINKTLRSGARPGRSQPRT